jgi:hypothetical protein
MFGKLDVLSGNLHHVGAFLQPAHLHFFDSFSLDTVDNKMVLLECNNPLELTTNPMEGTSIWSKLMGQ